METVSTPDLRGDTSHNPVNAFLAYPFSTDATYQQGLAGIVQGGSLDGKSDEEKRDILRRSEVFYFNRITGHCITVDDVQQREHELASRGNAAARTNAEPAVSGLQAAQDARDGRIRTTTTTPSASSPPSSQSTSDESEPRTLTFAELKALIEQGKTDQIPNNRLVPDEINPAPPSQSTASVPKKPWEVDR